MFVKWLQSSRAHPATAAAAAAALLPLDSFFHTGLVGPCRLSIKFPQEARLKREGVKSSEAQNSRAKVNVFFSLLAAAAKLFVIHENDG